ncbi:MAG: hypothetical protein ABIO94_00540 [Opitutaceae bacterium]
MDAQIVYYPSPPKVYSPEEMREIFSRFHVNDPVIAVLKQIFQVRFANAAIDAAGEALSERQAGHAGGRIAEITDFRRELLSYLQQQDSDATEPRAPVRRRK